MGNNQTAVSSGGPQNMFGPSHGSPLFGGPTSLSNGSRAQSVTPISTPLYGQSQQPSGRIGWVNIKDFVILLSGHLYRDATFPVFAGNFDLFRTRTAGKFSSILATQVENLNLKSTIIHFFYLNRKCN